MNLRESLKAAVLDAPPPSIDLDHLAERERRRRVTQRWTIGGAGLAVLALAIAIPFLLPTTPAQVIADPDPTVKVGPTEGLPIENETSRRLTTVLSQLGPEFGVPPSTKFTQYPDGRYSASWTAGETKLAITVWQAPIPQEAPCPKNGCTRSEEPDGSVSYVGTDTASGGEQTRQAENYRQNNTAVMVAATGVVPDFTTQQLLAAAKLPGWEL